MKRSIKQWFRAMAALVVTACSSMPEEPLSSADTTTTTETAYPSKITQVEAVNIANKVIGRNRDKSRAKGLPTFDYVLNTNKSRSTNLPDTLAYVLNYPSDGGFVIVSSDRRVYPVLAFNETGQFSFENESAKLNFIDRIGAYIEDADSTASYSVNDSDFAGCYISNPICQGVEFGQKHPWNKYVIKEETGSLVGCVAVATATIMGYSKFDLTYHGTYYALKNIITAIKNGPDATNSDGIAAPVRPIFTSHRKMDYSYSEAVDTMARIMHLIGKDVDMKYEPKVSRANHYYAYLLLKSLRFSIPSGYRDPFNMQAAVDYLKDNNIIFMEGKHLRGPIGHAWVADGYRYCVDLDRTTVLSMFIHCDWGWYGVANGYYSGKVFETGVEDFAPSSYFAVKREWY